MEFDLHLISTEQHGKQLFEKPHTNLWMFSLYVLVVISFPRFKESILFGKSVWHAKKQLYFFLLEFYWKTQSVKFICAIESLTQHLLRFALGNQLCLQRNFRSERTRIPAYWRKLQPHIEHWRICVSEWKVQVQRSSSTCWC